MTTIKFPRTPKHLCLNRRFSEAQKSEMRELRKHGHTLAKIAKIFDCSYVTVAYHTNKEYRLRFIVQASENFKKRYFADKARFRKLRADSKKRKIQLMGKELAEYQKAYAKEYAKKRRAKLTA
jgi:hypothetical protein